jgi:hypothetical protein
MPALVDQFGIGRLAQRRIVLQALGNSIAIRPFPNPRPVRNMIISSM